MEVIFIKIHIIFFILFLLVSTTCLGFTEGSTQIRGRDVMLHIYAEHFQYHNFSTCVRATRVRDSINLIYAGSAFLSRKGANAFGDR